MEQQFSETLRRLQTTDKAHADVFNELFQTLITNDVYLNDNLQTTSHSISNIANSNLLINPDFSINQRGIYTYTTNKAEVGGKYCADRWKCYSDYNDNGAVFEFHINIREILIKNPKTSYANIKQYVEWLGVGTYTLSLQTNNVSAIKHLIINDTNITDFKAKGNIIYATFSLTEYKYNFAVGAVIGSNKECVIKYMKLEVGNIPTLYSLVERASELIKCQRFYKKYSGTFAQHGYYNLSKWVSAIIGNVSDMRVLPTLSIKSSGNIGDWNLGYGLGRTDGGLHVSTGYHATTPYTLKNTYNSKDIVLTFNMTTDEFAEQTKFDYFIFLHGNSFVEADAEVY